MNWDEWIEKQRLGEIAPAPAPSQGFNLANIFGALMGTAGNGTVGPGQAPTANKQGLYTPSLRLQQAGPSTPIDFTRMRSLLNSGALTNGGTVNDPGPTPEPELPAPAAPAKKPHPLAQLFSFIGGLK